MNKLELVMAIRDTEKLKIEQTESIVNTLLRVVEEEVLSGKTVKIKGFGTFYLKKSKPRVGRNPATGEKINIPATEKIAFKQSPMIGLHL